MNRRRFLTGLSLAVAAPAIARAASLMAVSVQPEPIASYSHKEYGIGLRILSFDENGIPDDFTRDCMRRDFELRQRLAAEILNRYFQTPIYGAV